MPVDSPTRTINRLFAFLDMTLTLDNPIKYRAPERYNTHDEDEFEVFPDVPVFKEHEKSGLVYDKPLLEAIVANCNRRITDTGDYCPVVAGHTHGDQSAEQPSLLGFAGPYRMGIIGEDDPKHAILADFRIFHDSVQKFRDNPRRSVEVWPAKSPEDQYFDPIACLGAETPALDLGLVYGKSRQGQKPYHYEMSTPGGTNTFIPTTDNSGRKKRPEKNNKEPDMDGLFSDEQLAQVIEAMTPVVQQMQDAAQPTIDTSVPEPDLGYDEAQMGFMGDKLGKYAKGEDDDDHNMNGALKFMETLDDDERTQFGKYMEKDEDEGRKDMYGRLTKYMCADSYQAGADFSEPDEHKEGSVNYSKEHVDDIKVKYRKERDDHNGLKARYSKLEAEASDLRKSTQYAKRESSLVELQASGYCLEVGEELEDTADLSPEQFARHIEKTIPNKYSRVPLGGVPIPADTDRPAPRSDADKYSKKAFEIITKAKEKDRNSALEYAEVLANVEKNKGEYVAA